MATGLPTLSERTRRILAPLVCEHIETGEGVHEKYLALAKALEEEALAG
jgi:hypothetical protein